MIKVEVTLSTDQKIIGWLQSNENGLVGLYNAYLFGYPDVLFHIYIHEKDIKKLVEIKRKFNYLKFDEEEALEGDIGDYDQFEVNERVHGIKSDFDESLYTTKLDRESEFYKKNVESCKKIAKEILKDKCGDRHRLEERGVIFSDDDDELVYSMVLDEKDCAKLENPNLKNKKNDGNDKSKSMKNEKDITEVRVKNSKNHDKIEKSKPENIEMKTKTGKNHETKTTENKIEKEIKQNKKNIGEDKNKYKTNHGDLKKSKMMSNSKFIVNNKKVNEINPQSSLNHIPEDNGKIKNKVVDSKTHPDIGLKNTQSYNLEDSNINSESKNKNLGQQITKKTSKTITSNIMDITEYIKNIQRGFKNQTRGTSIWGSGIPFSEFKDFRKDLRRDGHYNEHYSYRRRI